MRQIRSIQATGMLLCALLGSASANSQTLIADYHFNSGLAIDHSGNNLHGTIIGGVTSSSGQSSVPNTALHFNGTNSYVKVPSNPALNLSSWTLMAVVQLNTFYQGRCQVSRIMSRGTYLRGDFYGLEVNDNSIDGDCTVYTPSAMQYGAGAAGTIWTSSPFVSIIKPHTWYCFAATYDGVSTLKTYINGAWESTYNWNNQYSYPSVDSLLIGRGPGGIYPYWLNGSIDRLRIWDAAMSGTEVSAHCGDEEELPSIAPDINGNRIGPDEIFPAAVHQLSLTDKIGQVYPNPSGDIIHIDLNNTTGLVGVRVLNNAGQLLLEKNVEAGTHKDAIELNIAQLAPGNYILQLSSGGERAYRRFTRH